MKSAISDSARVSTDIMGKAGARTKASAEIIAEGHGFCVTGGVVIPLTCFNGGSARDVYSPEGPCQVKAWKKHQVSDPGPNFFRFRRARSARSQREGCLFWTRQQMIPKFDGDFKELSIRSRQEIETISSLFIVIRNVDGGEG